MNCSFMLGIVIFFSNVLKSEERVTKLPHRYIHVFDKFTADEDEKFLCTLSTLLTRSKLIMIIIIGIFQKANMQENLETSNAAVK